MKKTLATILIILLVCIIFSVAKHKMNEIKDSEMSIGKIPSEQNSNIFYNCINLDAKVLARCVGYGGEIKSYITRIDIGILNTVGCYPKEKSTDVGKKCRFDIQCEGQCLWLSGDTLTGGESSKCSSFKKPFFIYPKQVTDSLCIEGATEI